MYDVVVVGGGLIGSAAAYHLAREGVRVLLVDRADPGRATDAGAGILAPAVNTRDPEPWYTLAARAVAYYPTLVQRLHADGVEETGYSAVPLLVIASSPEELPRFQRLCGVLAERIGREGTLPTSVARELSADEARELFPPLGDVAAALWYRDAARVDGRRFNDALRQAAGRHGLELRTADVEALHVVRGRIRGVRVAGQVVPTDNVVIAGGAWSSRFAEQLGIYLPLRPQRGQIVHLRPRHGRPAEWPIVRAISDFYLVPWPDQRVAAGATREDDSGFDSRATAAGLRQLLDRALALAPGLADAAIHELRVGLRPVTGDALPVLGPVPGVAGVCLATGHGPTGLQLGPYSGKLVADLVLGRSPEIDLEACRPTRFARDEG